MTPLCAQNSGNFCKSIVKLYWFGHLPWVWPVDTIAPANIGYGYDGYEHMYMPKSGKDHPALESNGFSLILAILLLDH